MRSVVLFHAVLSLTAVLALPASAGGLLVVSQGNASVLEYDESDGSFVKTFVEPVTEGFAFPGGIAIRPSDGQLYVASTGSGEIWVYDTPTGEAIPPPVATGLLAPGSLDFDATGSSLFFLADVASGSDTHAAVRKLELPGGSVTTLASDSTASYSALAFEGSQVYVSDTLNGEVVRFPAAGGNGTTVVTGLLSPAGIVFASPTQMLIAEAGSDRVVEYHEDGGNWLFDREVLPPSAGVDGPFGLALAPDGRLTVSGSLSNDVVAVDLETLAVSTLVPTGGGGLATAGEIAWSGDTLLVASRAGNVVLYYEENGTPTGTVARGLSPTADTGLTFTASGNLIVGSVSFNDLVEYDGLSGGVVRSLFNACPISFTHPVDITVGPGGGVYVTCGSIDGVRRFDALGISVPFVIAGSGGLSNPRGLAFGPNGNLFVASGDFFSRQVLEYDGNTGAFVGVFVDDTGNGGGAIDPYGLVFHRGSLFVACFAQNEVKEFDATSGAFVQTFVSPGSGGLSGPKGLAFGPGGDLYVTSDGDDSVKRYDGANGAFVETFVTTGSGGLDGPLDLGFRPGAAAAAVPALGAVARAALGCALAGLAGLWLARGSRRGAMGESP
jgi:DNA-binding beta-propeller fold protein YncE